MSFSVKAKEFVPAATSYSWESAADSFCAADPTKKERVCMAYYEYAECPYGSHCEHAHHFNELDLATQTKLLGSVPCEAIPDHFVNRASTPAAYKMEVPPTLTAYGRFHRADRKQICTPVSHGEALHGRGGQGQSLNASMCSHTSSIDTPIGSTQRSKTSSPGALEHVKMRLPSRCRYPHRGITGTYYDVLGLSRTATTDDILRRYRVWQRDGFKRMRVVDSQGAEAVDRLIVEARNVLGNGTLRAEYDRQLPSTSTPSALAKHWTSQITVDSSASTSVSHPRLQGHSSSSSTHSETHHTAVFSPVVMDPSRTSNSTPTLTTAMFSDDIW